MGKLRLPEEFKEFINLLNSNGVKYLLLGGWAVGYYGNPRATKDIEIINNADGINIKECYKRKSVVEIDNVKKNIISKDDLIMNKKSTNRLQDHADAEVLEKIKINPEINSKNILKLKLILSNITGAYGNELKDENIDVRKRKKDSNYYNDLKIINETILLYKKALETKNEKDVFALHQSFKKNPLTNELYGIFGYKLSRNKIYTEIEYRFKQLLKNEYSFLTEKNHPK